MQLFGILSIALLSQLLGCPYAKGAGCNQPICVSIEINPGTVPIASGGVYTAMNNFLDRDPNHPTYVARLTQEMMRTRPGTNVKWGYPLCDGKAQHCFKSKEIRNNVLNAGSYKQDYKLRFQFSFATEDQQVAKFMQLGKFSHTNDIIRFMKQSLKEFWFASIIGSQHFGLSPHNSHKNSKCDYAYGGGNVGYFTEERRCVVICVEFGHLCNTYCHWVNDKPRATCTSSSVYAEVPEHVSISYLDSDGKMMGNVMVELYERSTTTSSTSICSTSIQNRLSSLSFIPKIGVAFGLSALICSIIGRDSSARTNPVQSFPDNVYLLPRTIQNVEFSHSTSATLKNQPVVYECHKCWPENFEVFDNISSIDEFGVAFNSSTYPAALGYVFEATAEENRQGNFCSACFLQDRILQEHLNFETAISFDCNTVNGDYFNLPVNEVMQILPQEERKKLELVQSRCLSVGARSGIATDVEGKLDTDGSLGTGAAIGITFGGSALLFASLGFVAFKLMQKKPENDVLEQFKA